MLNRLYFRGFDPEGSLRGEAETLILELLADCPSDSSWLGNLERLPDGFYLARLDVYSAHGPFLADARNAEPESAMVQVIAKVATQVERWRQKRFKDEKLLGLRDPYLF